MIFPFMPGGFSLCCFCLFTESQNRGSQEVYFFGFMVVPLLMQLLNGPSDIQEKHYA